ncbi:MAG: diaminobutyrate acetyltransferase [Candidatus Binatia bacterium]
MWRLVRDSGVLDVNSPYSYLILCQHFSETCLVAEIAGELVGFVTAYRPPVTSNVIFVWQIGVARSMRGRGIGLTILEALVKKEAANGISFLEATVTPSNAPSQALFRALAQQLHTQCEETPCFPMHLFPDETHEAEDLFRIGPFGPHCHSETEERSHHANV